MAHIITRVHWHTFGRAQVAVIPALQDNFAFLLHYSSKNPSEFPITVAIDSPDGNRIAEVVHQYAWGPLDYILNTHKHYDHVQGNPYLCKEFPGVRVIGSTGEQSEIPCLKDESCVDPGDDFHLNVYPETKTASDEDLACRVLDVGGHTSHHIAYHFYNLGLAFVGDSLFPLGCGRLFEGTPEQAYGSLCRLAQLDPQTTLFSAHEYSQANSEFALSVDPENKQLQERIVRMKNLREKGVPTVPSLLSEELETNPFLRCGSKSIRQSLGANFQDCDDLEVFRELRSLKDKF